MTGMKKMTQTQENFNKQRRQPGYMEEESKSMADGFGNRKRIGPKGDRDFDSYSESDEGVNDQNAAFQSIDEDDRNYELANKVGSKR